MAARVSVDGVRGGLYTPHCAACSRRGSCDGLAAAAERSGVTIYESSPVTAIEPGLVVTRGGDVRARYVLRATEGYTADMPRRAPGAAAHEQFDDRHRVAA